jgi:RNA polymerase sigma-70 factor, ECF subfamily
MNESELRDELPRHHIAAFGWAMACCGRDVTLAESTLQSAYLKVLEGRARFHGRSAFRTWLFGVIRLTALEERRRAFLQRLFLIRSVPTPEEMTERSELRERLVQALRKLARRQREVLELVFYHDMTLDEAAEVMDISPGAARVHYARGKTHLRKLLSPPETSNESRRTRPADVV